MSEMAEEVMCSVLEAVASMATNLVRRKRVGVGSGGRAVWCTAAHSSNTSNPFGHSQQHAGAPQAVYGCKKPGPAC